jgi:hypothetical protein
VAADHQTTGEARVREQAGKRCTAEEEEEEEEQCQTVEVAEWKTVVEGAGQGNRVVAGVGSASREAWSGIVGAASNIGSPAVTAVLAGTAAG